MWVVIIIIIPNTLGSTSPCINHSTRVFLNGSCGIMVKLVRSWLGSLQYYISRSMTEMGPNSANDRFFCTMILTLNKKSIVMRFSPRFKGFLRGDQGKGLLQGQSYSAENSMRSSSRLPYRENGCGHTFSMTSVYLGRYVTCLDFIYR